MKNIFFCGKLIVNTMPDFHASWENIPIFIKTYNLYKIFYEYLPSFPRKDRYVFGQKCEAVLIEILELIISASNLTRQEKLPILRRASTKLDVLKVLFKLGTDLKIIENKKYQILKNNLEEIGKMLGGWIKTTVNQT